MQRRLFSTGRRLLSHENPLGLPRSGAPPQIPRMQRGLPKKQNIRDVKHVVAVSSAKGGVGKSTIAVNLALSLARLGHRTGILDTDIFGPSIPTLLNLSGEPRLTEDNRLIPLQNYGLPSMSMGYLVPESSPVVWRGLMVQKALQQLLFSVAWPSLDILILDLPPGTGDVQLTITQSIHLSGALIVSTPQDLSLKDAIRGVEMFKKVDVKILGMVQNMSVFRCEACGHEQHIFGTDGVKQKCEELGIKLLGDVPLHARICDDADGGRPTVVAEPESERAAAFRGIAERVADEVG
ncbi:P-loop containing nucleoside triphosphate hydrolase protein, partial [Rhizodiscina lignyota]